MKVVTIIGARPQFVKAAPLSKELRSRNINEIVVHTGQHYDGNMSAVFFQDLQIAEPDYNLGIGSGSHGKQTGSMLAAIERCLQDERPDLVVVFGDTNSTIAGALAASKMQISVGHIEAGLRSFNRTMPEEINRILTDHCSDLLFCPTPVAVENLKQENITSAVHLVGDTMYDAMLAFKEIAQHRSSITRDLMIETNAYLLATVHRPYNTDDANVLSGILQAFNEIDMPIVFPVHPRTQKKISSLMGKATTNFLNANIIMINPIGYLDMLALESNARLILTDSGGVQKEAYFFETPCVTLRPETEWTELVEAGVNFISGSSKEKIIATVDRVLNTQVEFPRGLYGNGTASQQIAAVLEKS